MLHLRRRHRAATSWAPCAASQRRRRRTARPCRRWRAADEEPEAPPDTAWWLLGFALFLVYPVALEYLGFLVATFLLMALFMLVGQWRNLLGVLADSAIGTLVLFYIFRGIVYVSLPLGVGPFQDFTLWVAQLLQHALRGGPEPCRTCFSISATAS